MDVSFVALPSAMIVGRILLYGGFGQQKRNRIFTSRYVTSAESSKLRFMHHIRLTKVLTLDFLLFAQLLDHADHVRANLFDARRPAVDYPVP